MYVFVFVSSKSRKTKRSEKGDKISTDVLTVEEEKSA
jgi:hypothetical protein